MAGRGSRAPHAALASAACHSHCALSSQQQRLALVFFFVDLLFLLFFFFFCGRDDGRHVARTALWRGHDRFVVVVVVVGSRAVAR